MIIVSATQKRRLRPAASHSDRGRSNWSAGIAIASTYEAAIQQMAMVVSVFTGAFAFPPPGFLPARADLPPHRTSYLALLLSRP